MNKSIKKIIIEEGAFPGWDKAKMVCEEGSYEATEGTVMTLPDGSGLDQGLLVMDNLTEGNPIDVRGFHFNDNSVSVFRMPDPVKAVVPPSSPVPAMGDRKPHTFPDLVNHVLKRIAAALNSVAETFDGIAGEDVGRNRPKEPPEGIPGQQEILIL